MKILLIGSSRGIGKELALEFLNEGHRLVGLSRNSGEISHENYQHFQVDITKEDEVCAFFNQIGDFDLLINNAAIGNMNSILLTDFQTISQLLITNVAAPILLTREYVKSCIRQNRRGTIINFSSIATEQKISGESIYTTTKKAIEEFTVQSADELSKFNISISAIKLGLFNIGLSKNIPKNSALKILQTTAKQEYASIESLKNIILKIQSLPHIEKNGVIFNME